MSNIPTERVNATCAHCGAELHIRGDGRHASLNHPTQGGIYFCHENCKAKALPALLLTGVVVGPVHGPIPFVGLSELQAIQARLVSK